MKNNSGIYDSNALIDSLILDCDSAVGAVAKGEYIKWCRVMYEMVQKLALLKNGITNDLKSKDDMIASLREQLLAEGVKVDMVSADDLISEDKITCQEDKPVVK